MKGQSIVIGVHGFLGRAEKREFRIRGAPAEAQVAMTVPFRDIAALIRRGPPRCFDWKRRGSSMDHEESCRAAERAGFTVARAGSGVVADSLEEVKRCLEITYDRIKRALDLVRGREEFVFNIRGERLGGKPPRLRQVLATLRRAGVKMEVDLTVRRVAGGKSIVLPKELRRRFGAARLPASPPYRIFARGWLLYDVGEEERLDRAIAEIERRYPGLTVMGQASWAPFGATADLSRQWRELLRGEARSHSGGHRR